MKRSGRGGRSGRRGICARQWPAWAPNGHHASGLQNLVSNAVKLNRSLTRRVEYPGGGRPWELKLPSDNESHRPKTMKDFQVFQRLHPAGIYGRLRPGFVNNALLQTGRLIHLESTRWKAAPSPSSSVLENGRAAGEGFMQAFGLSACNSHGRPLDSYCKMKGPFGFENHLLPESSDCPTPMPWTRTGTRPCTFCGRDDPHDRVAFKGP
jgi:hypothetical protein